MKISKKIRFTMFPRLGNASRMRRGTSDQFQNDAVLHPSGRMGELPCWRFKSQMALENQLKSLVMRNLERALNEDQGNFTIFK